MGNTVKGDLGHCVKNLNNSLTRGCAFNGTSAHKNIKKAVDRREPHLFDLTLTEMKVETLSFITFNLCGRELE